MIWRGHSVRQSGISLIELMIGMVIGLIIVGITFSVYLQSKATLRDVAAVADLQENAIYAMQRISRDIAHAGYVGLAPVRGAVDGRAGTAAAASLPAIGNDCAASWAIDVIQPLEVIDAYASQYSGAGECLDASVDSGARAPVPGTDVLMIKKADVNTAATLQSGVIYLRSGFSNAALFEQATPPADVLAPFEDRAWLPVIYFVRNFYLEPGDGIPSLRKLELGVDPVNGSYGLVEEEVAPGIENMQIQMGIDSNQDGSADFYLDASNANAAPAQAVSLRVWLLLRMLDPDRSYTNSNTYELAGRTIDPADPDDNFQRQVLIFTVPMRN